MLLNHKLIYGHLRQEVKAHEHVLTCRGWTAQHARAHETTLLLKLVVGCAAAGRTFWQAGCAGTTVRRLRVKIHTTRCLLEVGKKGTTANIVIHLRRPTGWRY